MLGEFRSVGRFRGQASLEHIPHDWNNEPTKCDAEGDQVAGHEGNDGRHKKVERDGERVTPLPGVKKRGRG